VAAHLDPEILIVDEVLAVGDAEFQKKCLGKMGEVAGEGRTVLFVSHNMNSISELCAKCLLISEGKIAENGKTSEVIDLYLQSKDAKSQRTTSQDAFERNFVGPYEILEVWLENALRNETYTFNHHDDIVFCMKYRSFSKQVVVGVSARDVYNQPLIFLSNVNDKVILDSTTKESTLRVTLPRNLLRGGEYFVTFSLNTGNNVHCDLWRNVVKFHINDTNLGQYLALFPIIFEGKWSLLS